MDITGIYWTPKSLCWYVASHGKQILQFMDRHKLALSRQAKKWQETQG